MTSFARNAATGGALVVCAFAGVLGYCALVIPASLRESKATLNQFFDASRRHQTPDGLATLTPRLREQIGKPGMQNLWRDFEHKNGPIQKWTPADAGVRAGGRVCLWPRSVDYLYRVHGTKGNRVFYVRAIPDGPVWHIDQLKIDALAHFKGDAS